MSSFYYFLVEVYMGYYGNAAVKMGTSNSYISNAKIRRENFSYALFRVCIVMGWRHFTSIRRLVPQKLFENVFYDAQSHAKFRVSTSHHVATWKSLLSTFLSPVHTVLYSINFC